MATEAVSAPDLAGLRPAGDRSRLGRLVAGVTARAARPVDASSVAAFRFLFGALLAAAVLRFAARGWIEKHYLEPRFFFPYYGFEWVRPLSAAGTTVLFAVMGAAAVAVAVGAFYRLSAAVLFATFTYAHLVDQTYYLNHYYLVSCATLLMAVLPLGRFASVDERRRPGSASPTVAAWVVWALRAQFGLVYFFAGAAKIGPDWLVHGQPLRLWLGASAGHPVFGWFAGVPAAGLAMSWAGMLFDVSVPFLLLARRTRLPAYVALVAFHAATASLFQIGIFPFVMSLGALVFFEPDWPRRLLAKGFPARAARLTLA